MDHCARCGIELAPIDPTDPTDVGDLCVTCTPADPEQIDIWGSTHALEAPQPVVAAPTYSQSRLFEPQLEGQGALDV